MHVLHLSNILLCYAPQLLYPFIYQWTSVLLPHSSYYKYSICSVTFSCSVISNSVTPWTASWQASLSISNSWRLLKLMSIESVMPSNHPSSVVPFTPCLQSFPASRFFPISQFFASGGQGIGVSASAFILPMNTQDWFPLGLTGLISLQVKGLSSVFSNTTVQKHQFFYAQHFL